MSSSRCTRPWGSIWAGSWGCRYLNSYTATGGSAIACAVDVARVGWIGGGSAPWCGSVQCMIAGVFAAGAIEIGSLRIGCAPSRTARGSSDARRRHALVADNALAAVDVVDDRSRRGFARATWPPPPRHLRTTTFPPFHLTTTPRPTRYAPTPSKPPTHDRPRPTHP